ncbi:MAG: hypothetical protein ACLQNE_36735 [Thermoguttaceae bacterium]
MLRPAKIIAIVAVVLVATFLRAAAANARLPENLARKASASASSEHNAHYLAKFAIDGKIPAAGSSGMDLDAAWCVLKAKSGDQAKFTLRWERPVELGELVYWGRTTWFMNECWKDYEVYFDDAKQPAARGTFQMVHGPQRVKIAKTRASKVTFKFLNSYGGFNPGALEIQAFGRRLSDAELAQLAAEFGASQTGASGLSRVDPQHLRRLIARLRQDYGARYPQAADHAARLDQLEKARKGPDKTGTGTLEDLNSVRSSDDRREPVPVLSGPMKTPGAGDAAEELSDKIEQQLGQLAREVLAFDLDKVLVIQRHEIEASHVYTYHYEGFRAGGGMYVISLREPAAKPRLLVASPTGQILDADLSYDGKSILFSWRQKEDEGYHLWMIRADGAGLTQLTKGPWHDYNGCWLPDGGIAFLSTRNPQFAYCWHAPVGVLHRMAADGSNVRKLSGNYLNDFTPSVLDDGRIIYTRWEYVDRPAIPIQSLWTINPDGAGLAGYFGNRKISPATFMEARAIPGDTRIICTMTGHNGPTRGAIGIIDRAKGINAQESIENITPDVPIPKINEGCGNFEGTKQYSFPYPLDGSRFLVCARGPVLVRTYSGQCQAIVLPSPENGMQYFCAQPIRPRHRPPTIGSAIVDANPAAPEERVATLVLQDVYNGLEPWVRRGEVKTLRVVREMPKTVRIDPGLRAFGFQFPVISCGATYAGKTVLGDVPVEPDGSACFRVPSGIPIYFMALDAEGRAVQRMRSFTHLMPGEVQGCAGCHEHRLQGSHSRVGVAAVSQPSELQPPEWGVRGFDYSAIVQPVLDQYCAGCHNPIDAPQRVDLTGGKTDFFNVSYECLARENQGGRGSPYVNWIPTYNGQEWNILEIQPRTWGSPRSRLAEVVMNGHPDKTGKPRFAMDDRSRRRVFTWIDLDVPYYGSSETAYPERIGCRQIVPDNLEKVLAEVSARRCAGCHQAGKFPRREWIRITEPEFNPFLTAPLAKSAGGAEKCGKPVFQSKSDPDYQAILRTFLPVEAMLKRRPRMDMPGGQPAADVCRTCR